MTPHLPNFAKVVEIDTRGAHIVKALDGATDYKQVLAAVTPILTEIRGAIDSGLLGIKDLAAQTEAKMYLDAVSAAVTAFQAV